MRASTSSRYAVFLILLVLGQEFCAGHPFSVSSLKDRRIEKRETKEDNAVQVKIRQKRAVSLAVVILTVTFSTALLTVGFEVYLSIKGCCGLYPEACTQATAVDNYIKEWDAKSKAVDELFLQATNLQEDVLQHNDKANEIFINLRSISSGQEETLNLLSPETAELFEKEWKEIEQALDSGNTTVANWSYDELNTKFESYFKTPHSALNGLQNFLSQTAAVTYTVWRENYLRNYQAKHMQRINSGPSRFQLLKAQNTKAAKLIGMEKMRISAFAKKTAHERTVAKYGGGKYAPLLTAYSVVSTAWSLGTDAYRIYRNVKQCKQKRDSVNKIYTEFKRADDEMNSITDYSNEYIANLTEGWNEVKDVLTNGNLLVTLEEAATISSSASPQTARTTQATQYIETYILSINSTINTNPDQAYALEKDLNIGLMTVKLLTKCYNNRIGFGVYVSDMCKTGSDTLENLYNQGAKIYKSPDDNCESEVGVSEITLANMTDYINEKATTENYDPDCIINSPSKLNQACSLNHDGYDDETVKTKMGLSISQVQKLISKCTTPDLTPNEIDTVCILRNNNDLTNDQILLLLLGHTIEQINAVHCP